MNENELNENELNEIFSKLNYKQKETIKRNMEFMLTPEVEEFFISDFKNSIYRQYFEEVSPLIAKVEVYQHDLPKKCRALIETVFRFLSIASSEEKKQDNERIEFYYQVIQRYQEYLISTLYILLLNLYIDEINVLKKTIKKFNHKGIYVNNGQQILCFIKSNLKVIKSLKRKGERKYKAIAINQEDYDYQSYDVDISKQNIVKELEKAFYCAEETLTEIQKNYALVITNGYINNLFRRFIFYGPKIVSGILAIIGAILLLNKNF